MRKLILFLALLPFFVFSQTLNTGWKSPSSFPSTGSSWTNPGNIYTSNNVRGQSTFTSSGTASQNMGTHGLSWNIYDRLEGVEVQIECYMNNTGNLAGAALYLNGAARGAKSGANQLAESYQTFGSSTDRWITDINNMNLDSYWEDADNFYVVIRHINQTGLSRTMYVDHEQIKIYYHAGWQQKIQGVTIQSGDKINGTVSTYIDEINTVIDVTDLGGS